MRELRIERSDAGGERLSYSSEGGSESIMLALIVPCEFSVKIPSSPISGVRGKRSLRWH